MISPTETEYGLSFKTNNFYVPANYFCHYKIDLKQGDTEWALYLYRYYSMLYAEEIEISVTSDMTRFYNDNYLRDRSYMYSGEDTKNFTSNFEMNLQEGDKQVDIYTRNVIRVNARTFMVKLAPQKPKSGFMGNIYQILSGLFTLTICCLCIVGCLRCACFNSRNINYNVDEPNPNWDSD